MRARLAALAVLAAAAVGCGSSNSSSGLPSTLTAVIGGKTFTPAEVVFVPPVQSAPPGCNVSGMNVPLTAMVLGFSETPGMCGILQNSCAGKKGFAFAGAVLGKGVLSSGATPPPAPDFPVNADFTVYSNTQTTQLMNAALIHQVVQASFAVTETTDASTCAYPAAPSYLSGKIHIDSVTATEVKGTIDATAANGDSVRGPFSATPCAVPGFEACALLSTTGGNPWTPSTCGGTMTCSP